MRMYVYLKGCWTLMDDLRGVSESSAGLVFPLGSDHLSPGLPGSLSLRGHGSLQLLRDPDILHLNPLHLDPPGLCCHIKG